MRVRAVAVGPLVGFDARLGPQREEAAACVVGLLDALPADDDAAGREVGALDVLHQALDVDVGVVDHRDDCVDRLAELVR